MTELGRIKYGRHRGGERRGEKELDLSEQH
jgi:hypothetical protein